MLLGVNGFVTHNQAYAQRPRSGRAHSRAQRRVCPQGIASKAVGIEPFGEIARRT